MKPFAVMLLSLLSCGCAAAPAAAGYFTSGGVTLYKSAKESGPKAEFVLFKVEVNNNCPDSKPALNK